MEINQKVGRHLIDHVTNSSPPKASLSLKKKKERAHDSSLSKNQK